MHKKKAKQTTAAIAILRKGPGMEQKEGYGPCKLLIKFSRSWARLKNLKHLNEMKLF